MSHTNCIDAEYLRGVSTIVVNGVFYDVRDAEHERAKSEAITEQAEELEACKAELAAYRSALSHLTPEAQLVAAFRVVTGYDEQARKVVELWKRIKNLAD